MAAYTVIEVEVVVDDGLRPLVKTCCGETARLIKSEPCHHFESVSRIQVLLVGECGVAAAGTETDGMLVVLGEGCTRTQQRACGKKDNFFHNLLF